MRTHRTVIAVAAVLGLLSAALADTPPQTSPAERLAALEERVEDQQRTIAHLLARVAKLEAEQRTLHDQLAAYTAADAWPEPAQAVAVHDSPVTRRMAWEVAREAALTERHARWWRISDTPPHPSWVTRDDSGAYLCTVRMERLPGSPNWQHRRCIATVTVRMGATGLEAVGTAYQEITLAQ